MYNTTTNTTSSKFNEYAAAPSMYYKIKALLAADPDMTVEYDHDSHTVNIIVVDDERAEALSEIIPSEYDFGDGEVLHVLINGLEFEPGKLDEETVNLALGQNPFFAGIKSFDHPMGARTFLMFKNRTIAYKADNYGNPGGYYVKTPEQLAVAVFEIPGLFITTEV